MQKLSSTLLQVRHSPEGLMDTCNQYLGMYSSEDYRKIVVYLKGRQDEDIEKAVPADKVIFLDLNSKDLGGFNFSAARKLKRIIRDEAITDILAHRYKPILVSALATTYFIMKSMTAVIHGNRQLRTLSRKVVTRLLLRRKFKFVGISDQVRDDILNSKCDLDSNNVLKIPLSIDIPAQDAMLLSRTEARQKLYLEEDDLVVGHIGRLSPSKDQKTLIRGFAHAKQQLPHLKLAIIGDGRCRHELEILVNKLNLLDSVYFLGEKTNAAKYLKAFDMFAMTSCDEGFGRVLLESMTAHCPIVATNIPAFAEVVGDTIDLCEMGNAGSVGQGIVKIAKLSSEHRADMGIALRKRVSQNFSRPVVAAIYQQQLLN